MSGFLRKIKNCFIVCIVLLLFYLFLFCFVLLCFVLFCFVLFCFVLFCFCFCFTNIIEEVDGCFEAEGS